MKIDKITKSFGKTKNCAKILRNTIKNYQNAKKHKKFSKKSRKNDLNFDKISFKMCKIMWSSISCHENYWKKLIKFLKKYKNFIKCQKNQ